MMNILESFEKLTPAQKIVLENLLLLEDRKEKFNTEDYPITLKKIKEFGEGEKDKNQGGLSDEKINAAYNVFKKEYLSKKVKEALGEEDFNKVAKEIGLDEEGISKDEVKFTDVLSKLEEKYGSSGSGEDSETENTKDDGFDEDDDFDVYAANSETISGDNPENEESPVSEGEEEDVEGQRVETPSVMYPDVVEPEPEPDVAPAIPHFEKISNADKDGFTRADDQWIDSKMTLLRKRGII